ncbi:cupredoxin domain-containing protein [Cohnella sp. REN36]|uniref:cupredoxin domain-containing protein n=1 Tax=Cohnella sp. REN36 TaxID=2887347 RepID=UPI001D1341D5|nr:cupredoxin domain-containing protein [Cohnella sp. REN36]MCC3375955.1 cupredoxin domain-containing protein [Cohnella sp. REN36]
MKRKWGMTGATLLAAVIIGTGCGGDGAKESASSPAASPSSAEAGGAGKAITINAKNFAFDQPEIKVKQGEEVTIKLVNGQGNHALKIEGYDQEIKGNQTVTFKADKAGEFKFECSVMCGKGHADMTGKLIVE